MNDETFASLMEMGFSSSDCQLASEFGCVTLEEAVNHLINPSFVNNTQAPILTLNKIVNEAQTNELTADESSENAGFLIPSRCSVSRGAQKSIAEKKLANLREETIKAKQLKRLEHDSIIKEVQADKRARQELQGSSSNREVDTHTKAQSSESNNNDVVRSRYIRNLDEESEWNRKLQQMAKDNFQREQKLKEEARRKVLLDIEQDRSSRANNTSAGSVKNTKALKAPELEPKKDQSMGSTANAVDFAIFRFRFPDGSQVVEKFKVSCKFSVIADFVASKLDSNDFSIAETFPPFKCYTASDYDKSLKELHIQGSVSLVVKRTSNQSPTQPEEAQLVEIASDNDNDSSSNENDEIPYEPLVDELVIPEANGEAVENNEAADVAEHLDVEPNIANGEDDTDNGEDENDEEFLVRGERVQRAGLAFNIAQRLGGEETSGSGTANEEQNLSVDALRRQRCQAVFNRFSIVQTESNKVEALKYNCESLKALASENVLSYFLKQKLFISNLDSVSAICLIKMLKERNMLNSKTFRPFISSYLGELDLSSYRFLTNDFINAISLTKVYKLNLKCGENLTDMALEPLSEIKQLHSLDISFCSNFSGNAICRLVEKLPNLGIFKAAGTKVSSASMNVIFSDSKSFPKLVLMDLSETRVTSVQHFPIWFPNLCHLFLNGIVFEEFHDRSALKKLRELYVANCTIPIEGLTTAIESSNLETLDLTNSVLTDADSAKYSKFLQSMCPSLNLCIFKPPRDPLFQDEHLELMGKLNLREINLSNCTKISEAGFESYMASLFNLREPKISILLASNTHFCTKATSFLSSLKNLVELNLDYTEIGDDGVINIEGLPLLSSLSLVGDHLSDNIFTHSHSSSTSAESKLFTTLTSLSKLNLSRNENISNFGLKRLKVPTLETLAVMQTKVTNVIEAILKTNMRNLKAIRL